MRPLCGRCKTRRRKTHWNSKWCHPCAEALKRQPKSTLTRAQVAWCRSQVGKLSASQMAERLKTSRSSVMRAFRGSGVRLAHPEGNRYVANPDLVRAVCAHYEEHGMVETQKAFPSVRVRSVVERYPLFRPRQIRWTPEQHVEAVKMAGLIPLEAQARFFNRPGANSGAMKSFWIKRAKVAGGQLHGMADWNARWIVTERCPRIRLKYLAPRDAEMPAGDGTRPIVLWIDAEKHLRPGTPEFIATGVKAMADFTRWVFGSPNPKRQILKMMRERA